MAKYKELMEACRHCGLCYKDNGSDPGIDAGLDNGNESGRARQYLEEAMLHERPPGLTVSGIDKISSECAKCHDDGFKSRDIIFGLRKHMYFQI